MDAAIARWRLRNQHLTAPHAGSVSKVMDTLLAVQAENASQSAWAVAARTTSQKPGDLAALLASGDVVRTHVLRPTWHYVARTDIDWLLALTGPRVLKVIDAQLLGDLELSALDVQRLATAVLDVLAATPDRTRGEVADVLREQVPALSLRLSGQMVMLLMAHLEMHRLVSSGVPREGEHTYATYADRVGSPVHPEAFDRDQALAQLALRYYTGHGPATLKDLAYWATLTITDVRRGLDAVRDRLESFEHDGRTYWHGPGEPPDRPVQPVGHLLQLLDEIYRGYQDSRWVLDAAGVVPRQRESTIGIALVDAQLAAGMKRTLTPSRVLFELTPYRPLKAAERQALDEAAARYGDFLGRPAAIVGSD
ncbi:MAG: winged helix DNA-binding domain-containing protein [Pseudonocardiaceae bacterium]